MSAAGGEAGVLATFRESPLAVKTVLLGVLVNRLGGFLNIFLVLYLTARGHSVEQAAFALGAYGAGATAGVLVGGTLADRLGARNATVISMVGSSALVVSILFVPGYTAILVAAGLASLVAQMYRPASATLLSQLTPDSRQVMVFGMYRFGLNVGAMAAPLVGFGLFSLAGQRYEYLFWAEALLAVAYAALAWRTLPPGRLTAGAAKERGGYAVVLRDRRFALYLVAAFCHSAVYVQYLSTLPLDIAASGVALVWYTVAVSLNGFVVIAFELLTTRLAQHWPLRVTIGLGFALVGIGVAAYGLPLGPAVVIAATLLWSLGEIIGGPTVFAYPATAGPAHLKGHYIGAFQFAFGLGTAVGPVLGGWLFASIGHAVWPVVGVLSLLATAFGLAAIRRRPSGAGPGQQDAGRGELVTSAQP